MTMIEDVTGIVLAGGRSSRFGSNKGLVSWEGKPLIASVGEIMNGLFPLNFIIAKECGTYEFLNKPSTRVKEDLYSEFSSLGGIFSGLFHASTSHIFVCGCDMPFIRPKLIQALCYEKDEYDAVVPVWKGQLQPLCGVYSEQCTHIIYEMITKHQYKIQDLFENIRTRFFVENEIKPIDPDGTSFMDIDTREDYERALSIKQGQRLSYVS